MKRIEISAALFLVCGSWAPGAETRATDQISPVAVSPGDLETLALVDGPCPTFTWGEVEGAGLYELVVYRLAGEGREPQAVLSQRVVGSASAWTPSLDRCLEKGDRYAWTVRSVTGEETSEWSRPVLFQVAAPSGEELREALEVVRSYLEKEERADPASGSDDLADAYPLQASAAAPPNDRDSASTVTAAASVIVDEGIEAASFSGDGSALTNLAPANLSAANCSEDDVLTVVAGQWTCAPAFTLSFADFVGSVADGNCPAGTLAQAVSVVGTASSGGGDCVLQSSPTVPYLVGLTLARSSFSTTFQCTSSTDSPLPSTCRCMAICRRREFSRDESVRPLRSNRRSSGWCFELTGRYCVWS